jgi:hypothetical protein
MTLPVEEEVLADDVTSADWWWQLLADEVLMAEEMVSAERVMSADAF